jgi:hypothetical protein
MSTERQRQKQRAARLTWEGSIARLAALRPEGEPIPDGPEWEKAVEAAHEALTELYRVGVPYLLPSERHCRSDT